MPEKSLNEIARELRPLFQKGMDALRRENFDYAIEMFTQVLEKEPAFYECRETLRNAQSQKTGKGGGFFKKMMSTAGSSPQVAKARMALNRNPLEAMSIAELILNGDANNSGAHKIFADAALAVDMPKTAVLSLESLWKNDPKDLDLAIQLGETLSKVGNVSRAEKILSDLVRANPLNAELSMALKNISARRTMHEGGYNALADGSGSFRDILKDKEESVSLEQEKRAQKTEDVTARLIAEYEERLKTEPNNMKLTRSLAELHAQKKDFEKSLMYYEKVQSTIEAANDPTLARAIAETKVKQFDHAEALIDLTEPGHEEKSAQILSEKRAFQLAECQKRVEKYPTDLAIRFEMGVLYFQEGKISEAIQEFQKAQGNPHKRIASMSYLAQCFSSRKMYDMAARRLEDALKEKPGFDEEKKDLIYNLGLVLEKMGKREEAIEQFKVIYETDIGYKDVAAKVDAFYAGQ